MPDNVSITPGIGASVAADEVSYSGDTAQVQIIQLAFVTGAEGSRVLAKAPGDGTNGLLVQVGALPPISVVNGAGDPQEVGYATGSLRLPTEINTLDKAVDSVTAEITTLSLREDSITATGEAVTPASLLETDATASQIVAAPGTGLYLVVKFFSYQLLGTTVVTAALRAGSGGSDCWPIQLRTQGMYVARNVGEWRLPENTALYAKCDTSDASGVRFNVETATRAI